MKPHIPRCLFHRRHRRQLRRIADAAAHAATQRQTGFVAKPAEPCRSPGGRPIVSVPATSCASRSIRIRSCRSPCKSGPTGKITLPIVRSTSRRAQTPIELRDTVPPAEGTLNNRFVTVLVVEATPRRRLCWAQ